MKDHCPEELGIEISKVRTFCLNAEISVPILRRGLNELFRDNVQLRQEYLRLRQKWTEEIGNKEMFFFCSL